MANPIIQSAGFLDQFTAWGNEKRDALLTNPSKTTQTPIGESRDEDEQAVIQELTQGIIDTVQQSLIIEAVGELAPEERHAVCEASLPLIENVPDAKHRAYILWAVSKLKPEVRQATIQATLERTRGVSDGIEIITILLSLVVEPSAKIRRLGEDVNHGVIFYEDLTRHAHNIFNHSIYEAASQIQCIATIALSPFAVIAELYRLCNRSINASTCLINICTIPKHIILSLLNSAFSIARAANKIVDAISTRVGFLTWHSGEKIVRLINGSSHTILSNRQQIRDIVYHSIGLTLLAGASTFIPFAPIQMIGLPIIFGSIYGTLNNQFTIRECPEYYTMGHYYDGTDLKGHAVKTNNVIIKPIVTGCYASAAVTKFAGGILSATGTLPYTAAALPVPLAAGMIAGIAAISLVVAHVFSNNKKTSTQENLDMYAALIGIQWTESNLNMTWGDLANIREQGIERKRQEFALNEHGPEQFNTIPQELQELASNGQALDQFNTRVQELTKKIESDILDEDLPIKYIAGWQANDMRNSVGYIFAGGGTLALAITTIFLRIYILQK